MSIVIFGDSFTFPDGNAATNRVHTYAKGLQENGEKVHVICFRSDFNSIGDGNVNGINYYHPFGIRNRSKFFIVRRWVNFNKFLNTIFLIKKINNLDKIVGIICYSQLIQTICYTYILSIIIKSKTILERSEHPLQYFNDSYFGKLYGDFKVYLETKFSHGIICISQYLIDFYNKRGKIKKKLFLVPSTVDSDRFLNSSNVPLHFPYILYCGSLTILKDGVNILIESFSKISEKYKEINLVLIGKGDMIEEEKLLKELVRSLKIEKRVFFLGQISRTLIPAYMINAKILALSRPKSLIADAGFPSKLTEYLASGVPIVVTNVGEIPIYLKDNKNAFISESDSVDSFADKLDFVLQNYDFARKVALTGRELTNTVFNYSFQAKRIISFINSI